MMTTELGCLTPFENFMFVNQTSHHPMTVYTRLLFQGSCNLSQLEKSLNQTIARHLLFNATIFHKGWIRKIPYWNSLYTPDVKIEQISSRDLFLQPGFDLKKERGIRVWSLESDDADDAVGEVVGEKTNTTEIWIETHHACADEFGIFNFIQDWRTIDQGRGDQLPLAYDAERYQQGIKSLGCLSWKQILRTLRFYCKSRIQPLVNPPSSSEVSRRGRTVQIENLIEQINVARKKNVGENQNQKWTINDLLLTAAYLAMFRCADRKTLRENRLFRIGLPIHTRDIVLSPHRVANSIMMCFLDRPDQKQVDDNIRQTLLKSISTEVQDILNHKVHCGMFHLFKLFYPLYWIPKSVCASSLIASNAGLIDSSFDHDYSWGDQEIIGVDYMPPTQRTVNLSIGLLGQGNDLRLGLLYDANLLSEEYIDQFLVVFEEEIHKTMKAVSL